MRSVLVLAVLATTVSFGCDDSSTEGASSAASASAVASAAAVPSASATVTSAAAKAPEKKLITITTKSPEATAALTKAWDLYDNGRRQEALAECKKAVAADVDFAFGHACVGWMTDGAVAQADLDKAVELAARLPDAEKALIEALAASRHLDIAKYVEGLKKLAQLAPDDYRAHTWGGRAFVLKRNFPAAEMAFKKALDLNPAASFLNAQLARVQTQLKKYDDALASAKKYADTSPTEPAAQQALATALLNLDKKKEAEAALAKAVEIGPKVLSAYDDLAIVRTMLGDFTGAKDALEKSKVADAQPTDAVDRADMQAWVSLAEGKDADALKLFDSAEKDVDTKKLPSWGGAPLARSRAMWILGKGAEALKSAEDGYAKCDGRAESSGIDKGVCRLGLLNAKAFAQVQLGKIADAQKTLAMLKDEAKKIPDVTAWQLNVDMLSDQLTALDKKDTKAAGALLAKALPDDIFWKLAILRMAEKDGNATVLEQVKKDLLGRPVKDFAYPLMARVLKK